MRTEIADLGKFGLIERLMGGLGDDAVVLETGGSSGHDGVQGGGQRGGAADAADNTSGDFLALSATALMTEGVDFDLTYFPLQHLGYKAVTVGANKISAMNGTVWKVSLSLGVSAKLSVEQLDEIYVGARKACTELDAELVGGDIKASVNGLIISVNAVGQVAREKIAYRSGAREHDLICITRDLGAAYLGLHLLEREKRALKGVENPEPRFEGYAYLLERQLKPRARKDVVDALAAENIVPTSMIEIVDGLASDLMQICRASDCGSRIYLDRLPFACESSKLAEELHIDVVVAALNGGDDHELLFTVPLEARETVAKMGCGVEIIGHITAPGTSSALVTPDGAEIALKAQGFEKK